MLPTSRRKALTQVLDELGAAIESDRQPLRVRVVATGGVHIHGEVNAAAPTHLSIIAPNGERHEIAASDIAAVRVAAPNRGREWLIAVLGIGLSVPAIMGVAALLNIPLQRESERAFIVVYLAGAGGMHLLLRTKFRDWLTRWDLWFDAGNA